jgi:hypothetical protein
VSLLMAKSSKPKSFFAMTDAERDEEVARFEKGIRYEETRPLSAKSRLLWERARQARGRPPKPTKAARVLITVEPELLSLADRFARRNGLSRSEMIARGLHLVMAAGNAAKRPARRAAG